MISTNAVLKNIDDFHTKQKKFEFKSKDQDGKPIQKSPQEMNIDELNLALNRSMEWLKKGQMKPFSYWYFPIRLELEKRQAQQRAIEENTKIVADIVEAKMAEESAQSA